jgi:elongation factor G
MPKQEVQDIRNVALIGHGATGKTTLADLMLFKAGLASRAGSVDDGSSLLDIDDEEKDRKSSISSTVIHLDHAGKRFNLIDTPGYPDFVGQMIGAIQAVETAIITISASAGIEVNTRRAFAEAGTRGVGRAIVLNKCDADNVDFDERIAAIQEVFGTACVPLNVPVGLGDAFSDVVSTLNVPDSVPDGVAADPSEVNQTLMDAIVEADEELMMRFLDGEELSADEVAGGVSKAIAAGTLIPIFCTSSKKDIGVTQLMDALASSAPSPADIPRTAMKGDEEVVIEQSVDQPLVAQVFKTRIDPFVAKMSYMRIFAGRLAKDASVTCARTEKALKIGQLFEIQGGSQEPVDEATPGDIVAVVKMEELRVSDTLTTDDGGLAMAPIAFPSPMVSLAVEPKSRADQAKISGALQKVEEEDQTFKIVRESQTKEMVMQGTSELHLQIVQDRLAKRDKVEVVTRQPKIPYRETVNGAAEGHYRHRKQSGGAGQFGEVHFRVSALPRDTNVEEYFTKERFLNMRNYNYDEELNYSFVDRITGGSVPNNFIPAIEKGVRERMEQGVVAGYQVQDVVCELFFGKDHPVDSNETAFKTAASMCFREVFKQAKPALLEPIVQVDITVPGDKLGDVTSDLNTRRGRMEGMDGAPGGFQILRAKIPLAEIMTYSRSLSSMTGGEGTFSYEFSHYEIMPPNEQAKVIAAYQAEKEAAS